MVDDALRWFVELMDSGAIGPVAVGFAAVVFLLIVVHELGHAAVALACTKSLVLVRVGRVPGAVRGRVGRLQFSFDVRPGPGGDEYLTSVVANLTRRQRLAFALAGPGANLALAVLLVPVSLATSSPWSWAVAVTAALSALGTAENLLSRSPESDGQQARAAVHDRDEQPPDELADAVGRWMALYGRRSDARFSDQRVLLFGLVLPELGLDPRSPNGEAGEYWNAARAGWCWREVRPAPETLLAGPAREAWKQQALTGRTGLELAGAAAATLARHRSPVDVDEAFETIAELSGKPTDDERRRFAFRYGAALHDVERVLAGAGQRRW